MYEGNTLPAWRINQTGGRSVFSPRSVFNRIEFVVKISCFKYDSIYLLPFSFSVLLSFLLDSDFWVLFWFCLASRVGLLCLVTEPDRSLGAELLCGDSTRWVDRCGVDTERCSGAERRSIDWFLFSLLCWIWWPLFWGLFLFEFPLYCLGWDWVEPDFSW